MAGRNFGRKKFWREEILAVRSIRQIWNNLAEFILADQEKNLTWGESILVDREKIYIWWELILADSPNKILFKKGFDRKKKRSTLNGKKKNSHVAHFSPGTVSNLLVMERYKQLVAELYVEPKEAQILGSFPENQVAIGKDGQNNPPGVKESKQQRKQTGSGMKDIFFSSAERKETG